MQLNITKDEFYKLILSVMVPTGTQFENFCTLIDSLEEEGKIKQRLMLIDAEKDDAVGWFKTKTADLEAQVKAIQKTCSHRSTTYEADPAGGSDSYRSCDICRKEL